MYLFCSDMCWRVHVGGGGICGHVMYVYTVVFDSSVFALPPASSGVLGLSAQSASERDRCAE